MRFGKLGAMVLLAMMPVAARAVLIVDTGIGRGAEHFLFNQDPAYQWLGSEFTIDAATRITAVRAHVAGSAPFAHPMSAVIYASDGAGGLPGTILHAMTSEAGGGEAGWYGPSGLAWDLAAGTYWVAYEQRIPHPYFAAYISSGAPNPLARDILRARGMNGHAFHDLNLTWQIEGGPASTGPAIPEPATWAMLIAGFGPVGAAARRRTRAAIQ